MDTQDRLTVSPAINLLGVYIGLENEKDATTSRCLDRKEVRCTTWQVHNGTGQLVRALCTHIRRLFLSFGGLVCADWISGWGGGGGGGGGGGNKCILADHHSALVTIRFWQTTNFPTHGPSRLELVGAVTAVKNTLC